jgi:hypothetical protein
MNSKGTKCLLKVDMSAPLRFIYKCMLLLLRDLLPFYSPT